MEKDDIGLHWKSGLTPPLLVLHGRARTLPVQQSAMLLVATSHFGIIRVYILICKRTRLLLRSRW